MSDHPRTPSHRRGNGRRLQGALRLLILTTLAFVACDGTTRPDADGAPVVAALVAVSPTQLTGVVGTEVDEPPVVRAVDARGRPVAGVSVQFLVDDGSSVTSSVVESRDDGTAAIDRWTLGLRAGLHLVRASLGVARVTFTIDVRPEEPAILRSVSSRGYSGVAGFELDGPLTVRVTDRFQNGVPGVTVAFAVVGGRGGVAPESVTDSAGYAGARWVLGEVGENSVRVSVPGLQDLMVTATADEPIPFDRGLTFELESVRTGSITTTTRVGRIEFFAGGRFEATDGIIAGRGTYTVTGAQSGIRFRYEEADFLLSVVGFEPPALEESGSIIGESITILRCLTEDCYGSLWTYRLAPR